MTLSRSKANAGSPQDTDAAPASLIEAFHAGRGSVDGLVALGARCLADGDAQTAVAFARAARFLSPGLAGPKLLLGLALVELGEYSPAVDVLRDALAGQGLAQPGAAGAGETTAGGTEASGVAAHDAQTSHAEVGDAAVGDATVGDATVGDATVGDVAAGDIEADAAQTSEGDVRIALGRGLSKSSRAAEAIPEFERAVALAPQSAVALTWLGEALAQAKRYPEAFTALNRAVAVDPTYGRAHTALGEALTEVGRPAAALAPLKQALALDTERGAPAVAFAQALVRLGKLAESLPWFNRAIEIEPTCAEAFRHLGRTLAALRLDNEALNCIRAARQLRGGDWPDTWMDEAGLLLRRGDYRAGWRAYENREFAQRLATITPSVWNGDDSVAGESLLLIAEQGLGDTIQFFRFARHVASLGAQVTVEVQPPLKALLARSVAGIDCVQVIAVTRSPPSPARTRLSACRMRCEPKASATAATFPTCMRVMTAFPHGAQSSMRAG
jgi:tetratricopeptide (TPR) repeat protein